MGAPASDAPGGVQGSQADQENDWQRWGTYVSDRAWGTVREDYSADGSPWEYFPHDHARSRAYRWNEDGLAGFCDRDRYLCLAVALWNERDPILKERMFGLSNREGNHGEDVNECPTASGQYLTLAQIADELAARLTRIFLRDPADGGRRPVFGENELFRGDPHWRDYVPFYEFFHGETGEGVGASHQTGWTALVALMLQYRGRLCFDGSFAARDEHGVQRVEQVMS